MHHEHKQPAISVSRLHSILTPDVGCKVGTQTHRIWWEKGWPEGPCHSCSFSLQRLGMRIVVVGFGSCGVRLLLRCHLLAT